ncbi:DUF3553 domain-containing protein [Lichenicoccus sp.]|uniref:DUF3553 domain-containing protein n=1 Tax=Lichenicoccus sp. TaxID=2781899 RepID=UPI003D1446B0
MPHAPLQTEFAPGQWVSHPQHPEWGAGQVQSVVGHRVTVNFEHRGKVLINAALVALDIQP